MKLATRSSHTASHRISPTKYQHNRGKASHKTPGEHSSTVISSKDHDLSHIGQYLLYALPETGGRRPNMGSAAFHLIQLTSAPVSRVRGILVTVAGKKHPITGVMNFCMGPQPRTDFPPFILWVPVIGHLAVMIPVRYPERCDGRCGGWRHDLILMAAPAAVGNYCNLVGVQYGTVLEYNCQCRYRVESLGEI